MCLAFFSSSKLTVSRSKWGIEHARTCTHTQTHTHTHRVFALVYPWKLTELEVELQKTKSTQQQKNVGEAVDVGAHQMRDLKIFLENGRVDRRESCSLESL